MTSLEEDLIPTLKSFLCNWKRSVVDKHAYVEPKKVEFILNKVNNYHPDIFQLHTIYHRTSHLNWSKTMK